MSTPIHYPWHQAQWQRLATLLQRERLPHAQLLSGPEDSGKRRFAEAFAWRLLCEQPVAEQACGRCTSCAWLAAGSHPDLRVLEPAEGKRQIQVDQVRELVGFCSATAHRSGGRKVALIAPAESMNINTANALLKTLEEPTGDTVLLLVSHAPSLLPATVRSRCLSLRLPLPSRGEALTWLQHTGVDERQGGAALDAAGGRPLAALRLYESDGLGRYQALDTLAAAVGDGQLTPTAAAERLHDEEPDLVMDWFSSRLLALARACSADAPLPPPWQQWSDRDPRAVLTLLGEVLETRALLRRGVVLNRRLTLESLMLQWQRACREKSAALLGAAGQ